MIKIDKTDWASDAQVDEINAQLPLWRAENGPRVHALGKGECDQMAIARHFPMISGWFSTSGRNGLFRLDDSGVEYGSGYLGGDFYSSESLETGGYCLYDSSQNIVKNTCDAVAAVVHLEDGTTVEMNEMDAILLGHILARYFVDANDGVRILIALSRQGISCQDVIEFLEGKNSDRVLTMIFTVPKITEIYGPMVIPKPSS